MSAENILSKEWQFLQGFAKKDHGMLNKCYLLMFVIKDKSLVNSHYFISCMLKMYNQPYDYKYTLCKMDYHTFKAIHV